MTRKALKGRPSIRAEMESVGRACGASLGRVNAMADAHDRSPHRPVQVETVLRLLHPRGEARLVDATVGAGGHARAWLEAAPSTMVLGIDRDPEILESARSLLAPYGERVRLVRASFADLGALADEWSPGGVDAVLFDLGVSSLQLDRPERGFSFRQDGPLDMRMDPSLPHTAADLLNEAPEERIERALREWGDEPKARRIARAIVERRRRAPLRRTLELADLVARVLGGPRGRRHPATRTFQALRIWVNDEIEQLRRGLQAALERLTVGGRLVTITFHGGEDRVVKEALREAVRSGSFRSLVRRPVRPTPEEVRINPRARSSRVRAVERVDRR